MTAYAEQIKFLVVMKKIFITIIFLLVTGGSVYFAWPFIQNLLFSQPTNTQPASTPITKTSDLIKSLTDKPVFDFWFRDDEIYFMTTDGQIFKITAGGAETNVNDQKIFNLASVSASTDGSSVLVSFGMSNKIFSVFNLITKTWQSLSAGTAAATWSPNQNQLAVLKNSGVDSSLEILNIADQKTSPVLKFNGQDFDLNWVVPDAIYLTQKPAAGFAASIWSMSIKNKTLQPLIFEESGLMVQWSFDGKIGLKFTNTTHENALTLINQNNQLLEKLSLFKTLPSKCSFGGSVLWCGVPLDIPRNNLLPNDYLNNKIYFQDSIIAFDTASNTVKEIFDGQAPIVDVQKITKQGDKLFFINRYDKKLYSLAMGK